MDDLAYQTKTELAKDLKSSAYLLIVVGCVGVITLFLYWIDIISLPLNQTSKYMIIFVLGFLFIFFIIMGMKSAKDYQKLLVISEHERDISKEIFAWCHSTMTADSIDEKLDELEDGQIAYFARTEEMRRLISSRFLNIEEGLFEGIIESLYTEFFPE